MSSLAAAAVILLTSAAQADDTAGRYRGGTKGAWLYLVDQPVVKGGETTMPPNGGSHHIHGAAPSVHHPVTGEAVAEIDAPHELSAAHGDTAHAEIFAGYVRLSLSGHEVRAFGAKTEATATCLSNGQVSLDTGALFSSLEIDGLPVNAQPGANEEHAFLGGRVIVNEQTFSTSADGRSGDAASIGIRLIVDGVGEVTWQTAHAGIDCGSVPDPAEYVIGTGAIASASGAKRYISFSLSPLKDDGTQLESLYFRDPQNGLSLEAVQVTSYEALNENTRRIRGEAVIDGTNELVTFELELVDDPSGDSVSLRLSTGYEASGPLAPGGLRIM